VLALEFLHENEVIYRDLKPDNLLLTVDGHIKLVSFGAARCDLSFGEKTGAVCGSRGYMAPEVLGLRGIADFRLWPRRGMGMKSIGGHLVSYCMK
jgi:serine/threonine protein kinase